MVLRYVMYPWSYQTTTVLGNGPEALEVTLHRYRRQLIQLLQLGTAKLRRLLVSV